MSSAATPVAHERVVRWLEEGQGQFSALLGILNDYHRLQLRNQLQSSEADCDKLRHEVGSYRGEAERHVKEREDIAASLTRSMNEALARLRGETL